MLESSVSYTVALGVILVMAWRQLMSGCVKIESEDASMHCSYNWKTGSDVLLISEFAKSSSI
jgi:hypothetical protein